MMHQSVPIGGQHCQWQQQIWCWWRWRQRASCQGQQWWWCTHIRLQQWQAPCQWRRQEECQGQWRWQVRQWWQQQPVCQGQWRQQVWWGQHWQQVRQGQRRQLAPQRWQQQWVHQGGQPCQGQWQWQAPCWGKRRWRERRRQQQQRILTENNSCDGHPLSKNKFSRQLIQRQDQDCFKYKNATSIKIRGRQLQQWVWCNFGLLNYSSNFSSIFGSPPHFNCWFLF
jgi:hypothetical protein